MKDDADPLVRFTVDTGSIDDSVASFTLTLSIQFENDSNTKQDFIVTITMAECSEFLIFPDLSVV